MEFHCASLIDHGCGQLAGSESTGKGIMWGGRGRRGREGYGADLDTIYFADSVSAAAAKLPLSAGGGQQRGAVVLLRVEEADAAGDLPIRAHPHSSLDSQGVILADRSPVALGNLDRKSVQPWLGGDARDSAVRAESQSGGNLLVRDECPVLTSSADGN
jgi:hypothetical protein